MKTDIRTLIKYSLKNISNATEKEIDDFRLWISQKPDIYFRKEDEKTKRNEKMSDSSTLYYPKKERRNTHDPLKNILIYKKVMRIDNWGNNFHSVEKDSVEITYTQKMSAFYYSDKGAESDKNNYCPITKLQKFLNDPRSKFLSTKEIKYYYHNYRALYYLELYPRLPSRWQIATLEKQLQEIAHAIRNSESNPRNNKRKAKFKMNDPNHYLLALNGGIPSKMILERGSYMIGSLPLAPKYRYSKEIIFLFI